MLKNKIIQIVIALLVLPSAVNAQTFTLHAIIDSVKQSNPVVKMYDHEIRSMDEAAKGAKSWMAPQFGFGQYMTPYNTNLWKRNGEMLGMGSVMLSGEQMIPNKKKLEADERYMKAMSSVEAQKKNASLNELVQDAKQYYYEWIVLKKKLLVLEENRQVLEFMISNAELRYKNGLEKISAYYKAKSALGETMNMQLMFENDIIEKKIRINTLMGRNAMSFLEIDSTYALSNFSNLVFDSTLFYSVRSDLKSLDQEIRLTQLKQEIERAALKPQFGVKYDNSIGFGGQPMQYSIMGMVKIPIVNWASKMNKANIESLKWKANAFQSQKEMLLNEYTGMAYAMRNEFDLKKKQLNLYKDQIIPALKNNFKTMQIGFEQNTEELFMLYDAWESLNMKKLEFVDLLSQALKLQVAIERVIEKN